MQLLNNYYWFKSALTPKQCNRILEAGMSELVKKLIGADLNNSSISAIVNDLSKKNGDKYYDH